MKVTVLGTAPPLKTLIAGQAGTSLLVEEDESCLLLDCGPGSVDRLDRVGVDVRRIETLLLTHHHWDHVADVPFFVLGRWEASQFGASGGRPFAKPLNVHGPAGTARLLDRFFGPDGAFAHDIATRVAEDIGVPLYGTRGVPAPFPPVMPDGGDLEPGRQLRIDPFVIDTSVALHCQPYLASLAYRVESPAGAIVFSGDSAPCADIARLARGAAVLFHDCNMREEVRSGLGRTAIHSTPSEVAAVAAAAGVGRVVAVHHGLPDDDDQARRTLEGAIRRTFPGEVTVARSLMTFALGDQGHVEVGEACGRLDVAREPGRLEPKRIRRSGRVIDP